MEQKKEKATIVIGLGEIGKPFINLLSQLPGVSIGIDIDPVVVQHQVSLMHICYPYVKHNEFIVTSKEYCNKYHPETVVIHSTVTPGTTRELQQVTNVPCVYSSIRGKHTKMESDLLHYTKFLGGTDQSAVRKVQDQFTSLGMKTKVLSSPESGELAKLLETTYFGLLIAWAQEMDRFSKRYQIDYFEMAQFFEEITYLPQLIFQPGFIGGHCVMPNIGLLKTKFDSEFLDAIVHSNEKKAGEVGMNAKDMQARIQPVSPRELTSRK